MEAERGMSHTARIALDIDNTLAMTSLAAGQALAQRLQVPIEELEESGSYRAPWVRRGEDPRHPSEATTRFYQTIWSEPCFLQTIPAVPGAAELVRELNQAGMLAGYVTRRPPGDREATRRWLSSQGFPIAALHHAPHPAGEEAACKSLAMRQMGARVLIDDHLAEVRSVAGSMKERAGQPAQGGLAAVLISQPYNRGPLFNLVHRPTPWLARADDFATALELAIAMAALLQGEDAKQAIARGTAAN